MRLSRQAGLVLRCGTIIGCRPLSTDLASKVYLWTFMPLVWVLYRILFRLIALGFVLYIYFLIKSIRIFCNPPALKLWYVIKFIKVVFVINFCYFCNFYLHFQWSRVQLRKLTLHALITSVKARNSWLETEKTNDLPNLYINYFHGRSYSGNR